MSSYTGEYYLRSNSAITMAAQVLVTNSQMAFSLGFSSLISYKDDQYYNLISADAFTSERQGFQVQYLSDSTYHLKYKMYDVRLTTKLGILKTEFMGFRSQLKPAFGEAFR